MRRRGRKAKERTKQIIETSKLIKESINKKPVILKEIPRELYLTDEDKITYIRGVNNANKIIEVVNVSYEIRIENTWMTILRYDSQHGYLHCEIRRSVNDPTESVTTAHVIKKGTPQKWFTWAIDDIKKNYLNYRRRFLKKSGMIDKEYE